MMSFSAFLNRVTLLSYVIFFSFLMLFSLSMATLILESKFVHVFRDLQVQVPGSNLVEWAFVSLNLPNLDTGPTIAIFVTASAGLVSGIVGIAWIGMIWAGRKENTVCLYSTKALKEGALLIR